ncbi:MAG: heavy metal-responsive transcriptional regulator [Candidatus Accumulibacter sp.]|jgi:MerR family copper efflux transcriptional regulator|nr:heavy metal-responsive transcriptional regulator [Accumulibacter sp.]
MNGYGYDQKSGSRRMSIGELARETGVTTETLRYYEHEGLLPRPQRSASGYREYDRNAIWQVLFILRTKELGFSLEEISDLLKLSDNAKCATERANRRLAEIEKQIAHLESIRARLARLVATCPDGCDPSECCPILSAIQPEMAKQQEINDLKGTRK